jgi:hypothetical protein
MWRTNERRALWLRVAEADVPTAWQSQAIDARAATIKSLRFVDLPAKADLEKLPDLSSF